MNSKKGKNEPKSYKKHVFENIKNVEKNVELAIVVRKLVFKRSLIQNKFFYLFLNYHLFEKKLKTLVMSFCSHGPFHLNSQSLCFFKIFKKHLNGFYYFN